MTNQTRNFKMAVADCPAFHQSLDEHELLRIYFNKGYTYKDIRDFMESKYGISLSEDQLRRKFKKLGLKRRGESVASPLDEMEAAIEAFNITKHWQEIRDPGRDQTTGV